MLGQDLASYLAPRHNLIAIDRAEADVTNPGCIAEVISKARPDLVVHGAAFTAVDDCERQPDLAFAVNGEGTRNVALACREDHIPLLYISTDYVFDGEKASPYIESDIPNPLSVYGKSKLQGEKYVGELVADSWIVRVSWLFGPLGKNFVRAILDRARSGGPLKVVDDQVGAPTYTMDLAEKLEQIVDRTSAGVYHVTGRGYCSWFEFAKEILAQTGLEGVVIFPVSSGAWAAPAPRPKNSRLANERLQAAGLTPLPPWQDALRRYLLRENPPV